MVDFFVKTGSFELLSSSDFDTMANVYFIDGQDRKLVASMSGRESGFALTIDTMEVIEHPDYVEEDLHKLLITLFQFLQTFIALPGEMVYIESLEGMNDNSMISRWMKGLKDKQNSDFDEEFDDDDDGNFFNEDEEE